MPSRATGGSSCTTSGLPVSLSQVLPALQDMGVEVVDERPYEIDRSGRSSAWVYDFGLRYEPSGELPGDDARTLFEDAFAAVWAGEAESDGFNALVLRAGLTWRQAMVLRAYAKYLRQGGNTFSQRYIEECLTSNTHLARLLVALFEARFDPSRNAPGGVGSEELVDGLKEEIAGALDAVASLDQDRILRSFLGTILATLRTSYYQVGSNGRPKSYVAFKLDPHQVPDLPAPRPRFEIWVYSPRVEGVHLRFGPVARGGLRWSDRREDFRTEVLGLVKAQMVKNAVIVPVGAKGGFVVKRPPVDPTDREAVLAEGIACYRTFISGLLDVTDNLVTVGGVQEVVPPPQVVRLDGDDTYLVVAADKGTATFSDIANQVSLDYGFWLGDAFASGGSVGYDHKAMGITARGAWESVKRHFRELGIDTQSEDFTVVGIGDMSGDVFGNGMLLSEHIRLVAAFDHRHVFLDPDPDAADVVRRAAPPVRPAPLVLGRLRRGPDLGGRRRLPAHRQVDPDLATQVRARLGLADGVRSLTPAELMRAILTAPVDLLWNGGIGTYVKARTESHADVGDKANDTIRVDGARPAGQGGRARAATSASPSWAGSSTPGPAGCINTDAIDNSAGVDTSDHEVNIKILLDQAVRDGALAAERPQPAARQHDRRRSRRLVLRDNYEQNVLLGNARVQAPAMLSVHGRFISTLEARGELDRALEFLPTQGRDRAAGVGRAGPDLERAGGAGGVLEDHADRHGARLGPAGRPRGSAAALRRYFPDLLVRQLGDRLANHPLRREIVTTWVSNDLVNRGGMTFVFRLQEETGASHVEAVRAYTVVREVFRLGDFWDAIEALDNQLPTSVQSMLYLEARRLLDRSTRWLVQQRRASIDIAAEVEHFRAAMDELVPQVPKLLVGTERERLLLRSAEFSGLGVPDDLAERAAALLDTFSLLDVVEIAAAEKAAGRRGGGRLLRDLGADRGRPDADPDHRPASRRPLERAGALGAALRPVRRAGRAHPERPHLDVVDRPAQGADRRLGAAERRGRRPRRGDPRRDRQPGHLRPRDPVGGAADHPDPAAGLVLDDVQPLLPQQRQAIQHPLQDLRVVALPAVHLADDAQRVAGAVGLRDVPGEPLVGHVRVVLEGALGLHDVDVTPLLGPGQRGGQLRSPGGCLHQRAEVDVVRHPARLEVGAVAGDQVIAGLEHGLRPVVEGPLDVLAALVGHGDVAVCRRRWPAPPRTSRLRPAPGRPAPRGRRGRPAPPGRR